MGWGCKIHTDFADFFTDYTDFSLMLAQQWLFEKPLLSKHQKNPCNPCFKSV